METILDKIFKIFLGVRKNDFVLATLLTGITDLIWNYIKTTSVILVLEWMYRRLCTLE